MNYKEMGYLMNLGFFGYTLDLIYQEVQCHFIVRLFYYCGSMNYLSIGMKRAKHNTFKFGFWILKF